MTDLNTTYSKIKSFKWLLTLVFGLLLSNALSAQYTLSGPSSALTGDTKIYSVSGPNINSITWSVTNGGIIYGINSTDGECTFYNPGATLVSCQVRDFYFNTYNLKKGVTVCDPLNAGSISGTQTICYSGDPSTLGNSSSATGGNGSFSYQWQYYNGGWTNISGATAATYNPPSGLTSTTQYRRKVTSCSETKYTSSVTVTVRSQLSAGTLSGPSTTCYGGDPGAITVANSPGGGDGSYVYQWQYSNDGSTGWTNISGAIAATYDPPSGATSDKWYRKRVQSCGETKYTAGVWVKVYGNLSAGSISGAQTICYSGDPGTLTNSSSPSGGNNSYTYQWQYSNNGSSGWTNISGATASTYNPPGGLTSDRWYRRRVQSCSQTKYTGNVKVTVRASLVAGSINGSQTICYGTSPSTLGNASLASGGDGSYSYQWQYSDNGSSGWANISGATATTYNPSGNLTADRWYRRRVQSCSQTFYTGSVKVTVRPDLVAGSINGTQSICQGGDPSTLDSASGASGGNGSYAYQWQYSNNGTSGWTDISGATATTYNPPSGLSADRWYRREVVSCSQTKYTSSIKVTVTAPPVWYADVDGDGFGDASSTMASCTQPVGYVTNSSDYDDSTVMITNLAPQTFYSDKDGDGYGEPTPTINASFKPLGYADNTLDQCPDIPGSINGCDYQTPTFSDENYIYSRSYQSAMSTSTGIDENRDVMENIAYFDGLGRTKQQIAIKGSINQSQNISPNYPAEWVMDWTEGTNGTGFFNRNGEVSENERLYGPNPFGKNTLIWACGNDPASNADGGWNTDYINVDQTKTYRYMVWVRRDFSQNGKTYHGTQNVDNLGGGANSNPYFWSGDLPQLGEWYLLVGIVHPYGYSGGDSGVSGVYDMQGNKVIDGTEFTWSSTTTTSRFRSYLYYATDVNVRQYFYQPILEIVDGNEVPLTDMFGGGTTSDIITHVAYDSFGRQDKEWLPYPETTGNLGSYRGDVSTPTQQFYQNKFSDDFAGLTTNQVNASSEKSFESSPLSRVLEQAAPGKDWQLGGGHGIGFEYEANVANEVRLYNVTLTASNNTYVPALVANGHYTAGELYKKVTKDENHDGTSSKLHTTEEFTDKQGRVVLKRTYAPYDINSDGDTLEAGEDEVAHDTYYVYDDYGNLTYVLPPNVDTSDGVSATELDELCYQYIYDNRNRLVEKKIPGKGWEYIVYNRLDNPVMTQDGNLNNQGKWLFTKYDAFGRVAYTGSKNHTNSRISFQDNANTNTNLEDYEDRLSTPIQEAGVTLYYSDNAIPTLMQEILTINYYDTYVDTDGLSVPATVLGQSTTSNTKGLATVSKVRVLDTNDWITTITGYDEKGRAIYTASKNNYLNTTDIVETELDFAGKVMQTKTTHQRTGFTDMVTIDTFTYDNLGRLLTQKQSVDSQAQETIADNAYDDLGQLAIKNVGGGLQTVDYAYNVRGWLTDINDVDNKGSDLFTFQLHYNAPTHSSAVALYNGNISQTNWSTANTDGSKYWYMYHYDALNRINEAQFAGGGFWDRYSLKDVSYDKNGNIMGFMRKGHTDANATTFAAMDNLVYTYDNGNKLMKVADSASDSYGFVDDAVNVTDTTDDYTYDSNGNMLSDTNKEITSISYNHLNLPTNIVTSSGTISYVYDAVGTKLQKAVSAGGSVTDYAGNYIYQNNTLQFFSQPEGYVTPNGMGGYDYVYQYKDNLGNVRLSYVDNGGTLEIVEENNYYPFGLKHKGYNEVPISSLGNDVAQKWKFGGKEYEDGLNETIATYDFGARNYDPALGRWMNIDPLAEQMRRYSPYNYAFDNPVFFIDPDGMAPYDWFKNQEGKVVWFDNTSETFTSENGDEWENIGANLAEAEESLNVPKDQTFEWYDLEAAVLGGSKGNGRGTLAPVVLESTAQVSFDLNVENAGESGLERIDGETEITGVNINVTMSTGTSQPLEIEGIGGSFGVKKWTPLGKTNINDSGSFEQTSTLSNLQHHASGTASLTVGLNSFGRMTRNQFGGSSIFSLGIRSKAFFRLPQNGRKGFFSTSNTITLKK